jgi:hypothetical protein
VPSQTVGSLAHYARGEEVIVVARCNCPSVGDGRVRMATHLAGCRSLEDLIEGSCCDDVAEQRAAHEPLPAEQALTDTYRKHAHALAALDAA